MKYIIIENGDIYSVADEFAKRIEVASDLAKAIDGYMTDVIDTVRKSFRDIASYGFDLHRCKINYNQSQNANGHSITGVFNISGRTLTAGANSYAELIETVVRLRQKYQQYVSLCHKAKRERNMENRLRRMAAEA